MHASCIQIEIEELHGKVGRLKTRLTNTIVLNTEKREELQMKRKELDKELEVTKLQVSDAVSDSNVMSGLSMIQLVRI